MNSQSTFQHILTQDTAKLLVSCLIHSMKRKKCVYTGNKVTCNKLILSKYMTEMYLCNIFTNEIIPFNIFPQVLEKKKNAPTPHPQPSGNSSAQTTHYHTTHTHTQANECAYSYFNTPIHSA